MANKIEPKLYKINLLLLFALCIGFSSTLYAAQNDEIDDEKKEDFAPNVPNGPQNNKKQIVAGWPCPKCTFINKATSKSCAICYADKLPFIEDQHVSWACAACTFVNKADSKSCGMCYTKKSLPTEEEIGPWTCAACTLENPIYNKKCGACKTPHPLLLQHMPPKQHQNKLAEDRRIDVMFLRYESENDNNTPVIYYRFKVMYNNSACEIRHTYVSLHKIHQDIIERRKIDEQQLIFPTENMSANYLQCGNQLQRYLLSLFKHDKTDDEEILLKLGLWICDICKLLNELNKNCPKCKSEQITISISIHKYRATFYPFSISIAYTNSISLAYVLDKAIQYISNQRERQYYISKVSYDSFIKKNVHNHITLPDNHEWDAFVNKKITTWDRDKIVKNGLALEVNNIYHHTPTASKISCPYIKDAHRSKYSGLDLALQCPIYRDAKEHYKVSKDALRHLHHCSHFLDEYCEKAVCRYGAACKAFVRLENNGNLVKDLSHIKLYRHPPRRNRQIQLGKNIHQFVCHQNENDNKPLYKPTDDEEKNLLRSLLDEVIKHGYQYDLCRICRKGDKCNHDVYQKKDKHNLVSLIEDKFNHPRYKKMGRVFYNSRYNPNALMLSLLLYTGGDCNYDLCKSQRNGDYDKWKIFDLCLCNAIYFLSEKEYGSYKLYSGLKSTKLSKKNIMSGYFPTYTSTTLYKDIAEDFMEKKGMMIEIGPAVRKTFHCCDVSWISKFPDEHEIVVARTIEVKLGNIGNAFSLKILDETKDVQTVLLTTNHVDIIPKIACMLRAQGPTHQVTASDKSTFNKLISGAKDVPADMQKKWYAFRHEQQYITINMEYMYKHYKAFIPLLCDPKIKNLLLLDKIAKLFPNVKEIICAATDCIKYENYSAKSSPDIVCSNFILGLKERLSKMDKQPKLTKIVIQTSWENYIAANCKLYPPQFESLGWQIGKGCKGITIVITKESYDVMYKDVIPKIFAMIQGEYLSNDIPPSLDVPIFKKLIVKAKDVPADVQEIWNELRYQQQRITIDMEYTYLYYKAFIPLLFDPKCKNLLLLDKIAQLFPNVTEVICKNTDRWHSAAIVCSNFILGIKDCLSKMEKQAKLTKVVIQTHEHEIEDDCKLYAPQFGELGWQIGKGAYTIFLTKAPYEVICKDVIPKIKSMLQQEKPSYEATSLDVPIFNKLINGAKDIPADVQKQWNAFRHQQQRITINMGYMYWNYKAFMPLLFDPNCKNLLLLDKIAKTFPNATEIICKKTHCIESNTNQWINIEHSADIVSTKSIIQTYKHEIKDDCKLYASQFGTLGWKIGKGCNGKTIVVTKEPYDVMYKDVIPKISAMLQGNELSNDIPPALDVYIFNKLIDGANDLPADVQQIWNKFRNQQQLITIDMEYMYKHYKAFISLLFDLKCKNLLLLDKIVQLFPNVTEIICQKTDHHGSWYSSDIVSSNFILRIKERLSKLDKHAKLTKIVIQTYKHEVEDDCKLYPTQFGALGWKIEKGSYKNGNSSYMAQKSNQITLTRLTKPNASSNCPPAKADTNEQKLNDYQAADDGVFDID